MTALDSADRPRLMMLHYACHPVCLPAEDRRISGDFPGIACAQLENQHNNCVVMYINGCAGDINPRNVYRGSVEGAAKAGLLVVNAARSIEPAGAHAQQLNAKYTTIALPYERISEDRLHSELLAISQSSEQTQMQRAKRNWLLTMLEQPYPAHMPVAVQHLSIGEINWLMMSGEVLFGIEQQIQQALAPIKTWIAAYCNGGYGYIPTTVAQDEGGYEPDRSNWYYNRPPLAHGSADQLAQASITFVTDDGNE